VKIDLKFKKEKELKTNYKSKYRINLKLILLLSNKECLKFFWTQEKRSNLSIENSQVSCQKTISPRYYKVKLNSNNSSQIYLENSKLDTVTGREVIKKSSLNSVKIYWCDQMMTMILMINRMARFLLNHASVVDN